MSEEEAQPTRRRGPGVLTEEHKANLARGREEGRVVRRYLEALEANKPRRGRRRTRDSVERRLAAIEEELSSADALSRLHLVQERENLQAELSSTTEEVDLSHLEEEFVAVAKGYGERKAISYASWREVGVDAAVLQRAGITRAKG